MSERPRPDMFNEAAEAAKKGDMFDEAMKAAKNAPVPPETDAKKAPKDLPKDADMFDVAMQEAQYQELDPDKDEDVQEMDMFDIAMEDAKEPVIELGDDDLEEVEGDMFDLAGAQVVNVPPPPRKLDHAPQKTDIFDDAMRKARKAIEDSGDEEEIKKAA